MQTVWNGRWAERNAGIVIHTSSDAGNERVEDLVGVGIRRNPKRAQLLVSNVLGKHIPADPRVVHAAGVRLGTLVAEKVAGQSALVVGFAETATLLGQLVADHLSAPYIHSTRRFDNGAATWSTFSEAHSHAPSHALQPWPAAFMDRGDVVVLVDDEVSTARTALGTIEALHRLSPRKRYVVASLIDMSNETHRLQVAAFAHRLGVEVIRVSLAEGSISVPEGIVPPTTHPGDEITKRAADGQILRIKAPWPAGVRESARHGVDPDRPAFEKAVTATARLVAAALPHPHGRTHVLGVEELMHAPFRIAMDLPGSVVFSTTTRSPAVVLDEPGYPLRHGITFPAHEVGSAGSRFAYNIAPGAQDQIVLVVDEDYETPSMDALLQELAALAPFVLVVVVRTFRPPAPLRGPEFGSYATNDVAWLVTDLSEVALEAPTLERELAMQGGGHYAESLPIEYQPDAAYLDLFGAALAASSARVAQAIATVGEQILEIRGTRAVLASLARAGTPIGVMLRRWAQDVHGLDWSHYSISIVRDRGIDQVALSYISTQHDPRDVIFVDGWTGKGAITKELTQAVLAANAALGVSFDDTLAVLADPGHCASVFGTRDDFLIPSACLNSTVSGLVSRTVLNPRFIGADQFHGAKFYRDLASSDVSSALIERVVAHFPALPAATTSQVTSRTEPPDWRGWRAVESVAAEFGIANLNLVKPGVGETTRVLLRRQPWKVLVRPDRVADLAHILHLARERGVDTIVRPDLAFSCIGLIRPTDGGEQ
ncbi:MAG: phosphoribosyltransferase [Nocardioides sp.]